MGKYSNEYRKKCDLKKKEHDEIRFKNQASIKTLGILSEPVNLK